MLMERSTNATLLRTVLDAIPSFVFVVDADVRILDYNTAAAGLLSDDRASILQQRAGEVLHCIHSTDAPQGCGHGQHCRDCLIRNSVGKALAGNQCVRTRAKMELLTAGQITKLHVLITTSAFEHAGQKMALLVVEDISQMVELHQIIPICMYCKRVHTDDQYWTKVEAYFSRNWDFNFSHGLCPDCYQSEIDKLGRRALPKP